MTDEKIIARMQADQEQGWPLCPRLSLIHIYLQKYHYSLDVV